MEVILKACDSCCWYFLFIKKKRGGELVCLFGEYIHCPSQAWDSELCAKSKTQNNAKKQTNPTIKTNNKSFKNEIKSPFRKGASPCESERKRKVKEKIYLQEQRISLLPFDVSSTFFHLWQLVLWETYFWSHQFFRSSFPGQHVCLFPDFESCMFSDGLRSWRGPHDAHQLQQFLWRYSSVSGWKLQNIE